MKLLTITLAAGLIASGAVSANHVAGDVSIYTARINSGKVEATARFDCSDSIYVFVQSDHPRDPRSTVEARWTNPTGKLVKAGERGFEPMNSGGQYAWDGIDIEAGGNALGNVFSAMFDPASGYEDAIGEWRVDVSVDGWDYSSLNVEVLC